MTSPREPLFGETLPLIQVINQERQDALRTVHEGVYHALNHYHQMMLLGAAMVGVVIPVLYAQGPALVNPWFLRRAIAWLGVSLFLGVLISGISKWVSVYIVARIQEHFARQNKAIASGDDELSIASGLGAASEEFKPVADRLLRFVGLGVIGDVLFYGSFLVGLYHLLSGFLNT